MARVDGAGAAGGGTNAGRLEKDGAVRATTPVPRPTTRPNVQRPRHVRQEHAR